jgi:hypothetical protein
MTSDALISPAGDPPRPLDLSTPGVTPGLGCGGGHAGQVEARLLMG